jgi:hypothetical protein
VNARELAVELLGLDRRERERLLAELPDSRRAEMIALMREAEHAVGLPAERAAEHRAEHAAELVPRRMAEDAARTPATLFETHFQDAARAQRRDSSFDHLNDGQLRLLLSAEQSSVQQRVIAALRSGAIDSWPPSVRRVVLGSLHSHQQSSRVPLAESTRTKPRWQWPWRRKRA